MNNNVYDQLLPTWRVFCHERRVVEPYRDPGSDWLYTVESRDRFENAMRVWRSAVTYLVGEHATIEWPEYYHPEHVLFNLSYPTGPCLVAGIMLFTDPQVFEKT